MLESLYDIVVRILSMIVSYFLPVIVLLGVLLLTKFFERLKTAVENTCADIKRGLIFCQKKNYSARWDWENLLTRTKDITGKIIAKAPGRTGWVKNI